MSGADTVGKAWARSEYGVTVVLAALFWLQSMKTFPGRRCLAICDTISFGCSRARSSATRLAYSLTSAEVCLPEIGQHSCMPFLPDVFG